MNTRTLVQGALVMAAATSLISCDREILIGILDHVGKKDAGHFDGGSTADAGTPDSHDAAPPDSAGPPRTAACAGMDPLAAHSGTVHQVSYAPDGLSFASYGMDGLKVWRASDRAALWGAGAPTGISPSGHIFAFSADSALIGFPAMGGVGLLDATDGTVAQLVAGARLTTIALSPDGSLVAGGCQCSGNVSAIAQVWRVADGQQEAGFGTTGHQAYAVAFSPDGRLFAMRSAYPTDPGVPRTTVWRVADRTLVWGAETEAETPSRRSYVAFSSDGAMVVAIGNRENGVVRVYNTADGAALATLAAVRPAAAAVSPDGRILAVAAEGGLQIWRTADWSLLSQLPESFQSVSFAPTGRTLLAGANDGRIHFLCPSNDR
jgi:WD40 repeat protein